MLAQFGPRVDAVGSALGRQSVVQSVSFNLSHKVLYTADMAIYDLEIKLFSVFLNVFIIYYYYF